MLGSGTGVDRGSGVYSTTYPTMVSSFPYRSKPFKHAVLTYHVSFLTLPCQSISWGGRDKDPARVNTA